VSRKSPLSGSDLSRLPAMPMSKLRRLWAEHIGRDPPSPKCVLARELAWRLQAGTYGGMDTSTLRLLRAAMRTASTKGRASARGTELPVSRKRTSSAPANSRLVRTWRGRRHEVVLLGGGRGFEYLGDTYRSLSEVARKITGARWSGPRFFGLRRWNGVRGAVGEEEVARP
jgi:hypothetical protein